MVYAEEPAVEARLGAVSTNIVFLLLGIYGWEYFQSLDVEYAVIRGRLSFRWPLVPYLVGRLFLFIFLILVAIRLSDSASGGIICLPGAMSIAISGDIGLASCSANLMIRTWVIWKDSRFMHILLLALALGHWIVLGLDVVSLQGSQLNGKCVVSIAHPTMDGAVFVYSLGYDLLILILSIIGLSKQPSKSPLRKRLQAQGVVFFVVAVVAYIPPMVFGIIGDESVVVLTGLPAITASTIASCRAVRSLLGLRAFSPSQSIEESIKNDVALTTQIPVQSVTSTMIC